jgi:hypothetical protein
MGIIENKFDQVEFERAVASLENVARKKLIFWAEESRNPSSSSRFNAAKFAKIEAERTLSALRVIRDCSQFFSTRFVRELQEKHAKVELLETDLFLADLDLEIIKILAQKGRFSRIKKYLV